MYSHISLIRGYGTEQCVLQMADVCMTWKDVACHEISDKHGEGCLSVTRGLEGGAGDYMMKTVGDRGRVLTCQVCVH